MVSISNTSWTILIKFIMTFVFALLTLSLFDGNVWTSVLLYSVIATAANYFLGDLALLPSLGNVASSVADGVMAIAVAWLMSVVMTGFRLTFGTAVALGVLVAIGEYFFHGYLNKNAKVAP